MLRAGELAVDAGRGDLQGIFLRNGVFAVQHGVDGAGEVYAVVDAYAAFLVNKNAQIPIRALFRERNVPDYEPKLFASGSASARTISVVLPFFFSAIRSFLSPPAFRRLCLFWIYTLIQTKERVTPLFHHPTILP